MTDTAFCHICKKEKPLSAMRQEIADGEMVAYCNDEDNCYTKHILDK